MEGAPGVASEAILASLLKSLGFEVLDIVKYPFPRLDFLTLAERRTVAAKGISRGETECISGIGWPKCTDEGRRANGE